MQSVRIWIARGVPSLMLLLLVGCGAAGQPGPTQDGGLIADGGPGRDGGAASDAGVATGGDGGGLSDATVAELDAVIAANMETGLVPGLAAAIVKNGVRVWSKGYGLADVANNRAATSETLFILASVSKTAVAVALMKLFEEGQFALDDDINSKLPFRVRNPSFPDAAITYRMLLTHTSSIADGAGLEALETYGADSPISLSDWARGYFTAGGAFYGADNFARVAPGGRLEYSNAGASLAGYLVEAITGRSLQDYCKQNIFLPLGMEETSWFLAGLDLTHVALPYTNVGNGFGTEGHYGVPDFPDGQLRSSVDELSRLLGMFMNGGALQGTRILNANTVQEMKRVQLPRLDPDQGLLWYYAADGAGRRLLGHNGAYIGTSCDMFYEPTRGAGFIMLANGGTYYDFDDGAQIDALERITLKLTDAALTLP